MHAVLITFDSAVDPEHLKGPFTDYAKALRGVWGLVSKTWLRDGEALGGFHIFTSPQAASSYLESDMVRGLVANDAFSGFQIRHFEVLDELSALTGSPERVLA